MVVIPSAEEPEGEVLMLTIPRGFTVTITLTPVGATEDET
jgi:hypothetical protein